MAAGEVTPERRLAALPRSTWLALGGLALWAALAWGRCLGGGLWGWDNYPLIAAGSVQGVGDVLGSFSEELMDGRYPLGRYWRPLVHLSFGLDHALWGLDPRGYHATDLALLVLGVVLAALVAHRWFGLPAAFVAGVVFGGNLVHDDVLLVPARRADSLALVFTLVALAAVLSRTSRARWLAAFGCAAALASKESGAIAVLVVTGASFAFTRGSVPERLRQLAGTAWPSWLAFGLALALRTWALGGLGGSREAQVSAAWSESLAAFVRYLPAAFAPTQVRLLGSSGVSVAVALLLVVLLAVLARRSALRTLVPLSLWFLALAAITAISRAERGWYELPFVAINALFAAALAQAVLERRGVLRLAALPIAAWALASLVPWRALSPESRAAGESARAYLQRVEDAVRAAAPGSAVRVPGLPMEVRDARAWLDGRERTFAVLAPYSVAAYAELAWPGRKLRVVPPAQPLPPQPDEVVLVLER